MQYVFNVNLCNLINLAEAHCYGIGRGRAIVEQSRSIWKNSAWLGTSIMIDRETPLAEIVGQMLLSKNTDVSTQSWVFISVNDDLTKLARCLYTQERQELKAGDDVNGNNVMGGMLIIEANVYTSCTNDDNETNMGMY